jgi:hypothetical protein
LYEDLHGIEACSVYFWYLIYSANIKLEFTQNVIKLYSAERNNNNNNTWANVNLMFVMLL